MLNEPSMEPTTYYVRLAKSGDSGGLQWIVNRFSPILLAKAQSLIPNDCRGRVTAEDIVADSWLVVFRRLADLGEFEGRSTPVFVSFLFQVLVKTAQAAVRKSHELVAQGDTDWECTQIIDPSAQIVRQIVARELKGKALMALAGLDAEDAELLLRYLTTEKIVDLADELGVKPNTLSKRIRRMIDDLRSSLGPSVFDDFV